MHGLDLVRGEPLKALLALINAGLVGNAKVKQIKAYFPDFPIKAPLNKVKWLSAWLSGFMEADGHVSIFITRQSNGTLTSSGLGYTFSQKDPLLLKLILQSRPAFAQCTFTKQTAKSGSGAGYDSS